VAPSKVELRLQKKAPGKWEALEGDGCGGVTTFNAATETVTKPTIYSGSRRDWEAIDRDVKRAEEEEKPEGARVGEALLLPALLTPVIK
jgi:suppressor of G2 allele of SKP1